MKSSLRKKIEDVRICDICVEQIPAGGTTYPVVNIYPEGAAMLLNVDDKDLIPNLTQNPNGAFRLDICLECEGKMGHLPPDTKEYK